MFGRWRRVNLSSGNLPSVHGCSSPGWNVALLSSCRRSCSETRKTLVSKRPQLQEGKVLRLKSSKSCCHPGWEELQTRPIAAIDHTSKTCFHLECWISFLGRPLALVLGCPTRRTALRLSVMGGGRGLPVPQGCFRLLAKPGKAQKKVGGGGAAAWRRSLCLQMNGVPKLRRHHCTPGPGGPSMRRSAFSCSALSWL